MTTADRLAQLHALAPTDGLHAVVTDTMTELGFSLARVAAGETRELQLEDREAVIVKLEGVPGAIRMFINLISLNQRSGEKAKVTREKVRTKG